MESSLLSFRDFKDRQQFTGLNLSTLLDRSFKSLKELYQRLDVAHEDTLKMFSVKQLFECYGLLNLLKSIYATLADDDFLECNALNIRYQDRLGVAKRLSHLQEHRRELIFPTGTTQSINYLPHLTVKELSLIDVRNLDTVAKISWVFANTLFLLPILSLEQKLLIHEKELLNELITSDSVEEKAKYLTKIPRKVLNKTLRQYNHNLSELPYEIIPLLNLSEFSDLLVNELMYHNIKHLDKITISSEGINAIFQRLLTMSITTDEVEILLENSTLGITLDKLNIPRFYPPMWQKVPDSVFALIPFQDLSKDKLFCLFHPKTYDNAEKFGRIVHNHQNWVYEIIYRSVVDYNQGRVGPKTVIRGENTYAYSVKKKEEYNKRRLALLSPQQYQKIRPHLDPDIIELGNQIFSIITDSERV